MRFEVNVDDGAGLAVLHQARKAYNALNAAAEGFTPAEDMPTYVQRLMDQAVAGAMTAQPVSSLAQALTKINELEAAKASLEQELATPETPLPAAAAAKAP